MKYFFKGISVVYLREFKACFSSPMIYVLAALFSSLIGWLFFNYLANAKGLNQLTIEAHVLGPTFGSINFIFLFLIPLITMKQFVAEKNAGTLNLLFHSRLSHMQIIMGKFLASMSEVIFLISLTLLFPVILNMSGHEGTGMVLTSYLGLILSACCYVAIGLFTSSICNNQMIAALLAFCISLGAMLLVLVGQVQSNPMLGQIFAYFSVPFHYEGFVKGVVRNYSLLYFVSSVGLFFYLTERSLESRNW